MKSLLSYSLQVPALSCAFVLFAACGTEAPLPTDGFGGQGTGGGVIPGAGTDAGGTPTTTGGQSTTGGQATGGQVTTGGQATGGVATTGGQATGGAATGGATTGGAATGGTATGGGGTGGGTTVDLKETVGGPLNGVMLKGPCATSSQGSVCQTKTDGCPGANAADPALSGVLTTDKTLTLGGDPAKVYTITLHVQGEVESKRYTGGQDQNNQGTSPKLDGFCTGGKPSTGDAYNVYMIRVASPKQDYFLNSLQEPGVSNHTTYGIDYVAKIKANGGSMIRLVAADSNCSMIRNCGPTENNGSVCLAPIIIQNVEPVAVSKNPDVDFKKAYDGQWVTMVVTDVVEGG